MPTYDYECEACGHVFEVFEGIHAGGVKACEKCKKKKAKRRLTPPAGVIFKGGGFYVTDYKGSNPTHSSSEKKSSDKKAEKSEAKSESKPESKSEKREKK